MFHICSIYVSSIFSYVAKDSRFSNTMTISREFDVCGLLTTCMLRALWQLFNIFSQENSEFSVDFSSLPIIWEDLRRKEVHVGFPWILFSRLCFPLKSFESELHYKCLKASVAHAGSAALSTIPGEQCVILLDILVLRGRQQDRLKHWPESDSSTIAHRSQIMPTKGGPWRQAWWVQTEGLDEV